MTNWGLRKQVATIALLPVVVVSIALTIYFTLSQLNYISDSQTRYGQTISNQLSTVSEYAVFSGNIDSLRPILKKIISDRDIIEIRIKDKNNETVVYYTDNKTPEENEPIWNKLVSEELNTIRNPIQTQSLDFGFPDEDSLDIDKTAEIIGYVETTLSSKNINILKAKTIAKGSTITLIILIVSAIFAFRLSKKISTPVKELTSAVRKISSGDYQSRVAQETPGELGTLEECVNIMAGELQNSRDNLESILEEATRELHETMEELEVRNVELDIARSNAIQSNKAKTKFLANMSHELRTPLGGILGFSELLESTNLEPEQRNYSEIITKSAHNLIHIIDDVLDLSKIESDKLEIKFSKFNIIDIAEEVIDLLVTLAYEKNIELYYYIEEKTPRIIYSDSVRIKQILFNLVGNAIKFTEKGSVTLRIDSTISNNNSTEFIFSVIDTGIGMNTIQQKRLFNAFTQADESIERKFGGTGLGLVISKKLANLLNGDIVFESQYDSGSTFTLSVTTDNIEQNKTTDNPLTNKNICFVDPLQSFTDGILSMIGFPACNISYHTSPPIKSSNYDLIIINIDRANMSGEKINKLIPIDSPSSPIIGIVSTRSYKELIRIKNYGFTDTLFRSSKQSYIQQSLTEIFSKTPTKKSAAQAIYKNDFDWSNLKILVVDDNDINLKLAEIILKKNGARVSTASSGQEGVDLSKKSTFDLIFMDLQMPDMDGYESSALIRSDTKNSDTVIIALTANAMATKDTVHIQKNRINSILIKPINETSIQNTIDQWVTKSSSSLVAISENETKLFSKSRALELSAGNIELANELTGMLLSELPDYLHDIHHALTNDIAKLKQKTHKLHGAARCCGTLALKNAAKNLESEIDRNATPKELEFCVQSLVTEIEKLIQADQSKLIIEPIE